MAHPGKKTKAARNAALLFGKAVREAQIAAKLSRYKHSLEYAIQREACFHSPRPPGGHPMDLRCPNCHTSDLKKVSLAYQEGLSSVRTKSRLRALLFGEDGP